MWDLITLLIFGAILGIITSAFIYANAKDKYKDASGWAITAFAVPILFNIFGVILVVVVYLFRREPIKKQRK